MVLILQALPCRILALYLLNFYTLIIALLTKINALRAEQEALLQNATIAASAMALAAVETESVAQTIQVFTPVTVQSIFTEGSVGRNFDSFGMQFFDLGSILLASYIPKIIAAPTVGSTSFGSTDFPKPGPWDPKSTVESQLDPSTSYHSNFRAIRRAEESTEFFTTTAPQMTTSDATQMPFLWAILNQEISSSPETTRSFGPSPIATEVVRLVDRIAAGQISQRERHLQRLCWETWVGQVIFRFLF